MRRKSERDKKSSKSSKSKKSMKWLSLLLIPLVIAVVGVAVWGPEAMAEYRDKEILNQIKVQETETGTEGYRYSLSSNEKMYILSECLNNQILPESEQNAMTRVDPEYPRLSGTYALVVNKQNVTGQTASQKSGIDLCNQGIRELKELGILPQEIKELTESAYTETLYSAIDVPEPRNNVLVWKIGLNTGKQNANKENRLLDAYVDADTGKIYEFYVRVGISAWTDIDADRIVRTWAEYMEIGEPEEHENTNPLAEATPFFKKYVFAGMEDNNTVVTIGFYEGINELYLKITK